MAEHPSKLRDTVLEPSGDSCLCIVFSNGDNYAIGSRPTVLGALEKYVEEQYGKTMYFKARMRNAGERLNTIYVSDRRIKKCGSHRIYNKKMSN